GTLVKVTRRMINEDIKELMGDRFSAKDFRTWAGTMICANLLARLHAESVEGVTDRRKLATAAVKRTAEQLGNTPAVCKSSCICRPHPGGVGLRPAHSSRAARVVARGRAEGRRLGGAAVRAPAARGRAGPVGLGAGGAHAHPPELGVGGGATPGGGRADRAASVPDVPQADRPPSH